MKDIASRIVPVLVVLAIGAWIASNKISSRNLEIEKEKINTEKGIRTEQAISNMIIKNNAIADWDKEFSRKEIRRGQVYTVQVEDALIRGDGQPILLFAYVDDIEREGNKYYAHLSRSSGYPDLDVRFVLECDSEQVKKMMEQKTSYSEHYAVVALISSLQRPNFSVTASPVSNEEAEIVVDSSDIFIARGRCLDLLFAGDYEPKEK